MKKWIWILVITPMFLAHDVSGQLSREVIEQRIDQLLPQLTLEEKVAMCHAQSKFSTPGVARLGIPELWMSDGPHGVRGEISWDDWSSAGWTNDSITAFPALTCLAATFNPDLSRAYGKALGEEALYREKDVLLGPGVNIYRTPLNGRNFEYMGEDPFLAATMVVPYIQGVQENGVAACLKHYVLNNQETWRNHIDVKVSDRALYEIYLPAFKAGVQEGGVWSIMGAYNQFEGQFCSHNERLNNEILKGDWAFDGAVISDWDATHDTRQAALYGLDLEMGTNPPIPEGYTGNPYDYYYLGKPFLEMIRNGEIDEEVVNDKVRRILRLMFRTNMNPGRGRGRMNNQEHLDVARAVGREGIVLLKNNDDFFPLDPEADLTIAVIGENATRPLTVGGGSSELKAKNEIAPLVGLQERFTNATIIHSMGYASGPAVYAQEIPPAMDTDSLRRVAIEVAAGADVVLFVGGLNKNHRQDCEGGDRRDMDLPFGQDELLGELVKVNEKVGVVLVSGNAVAMPWLEEVSGVLQAWYLGSQAGNALADVISGDVSPSGKLPFSFPRELNDNPAHHYGELSYPGNGIQVDYEEDILVGYRWHDTKEIDPLFAFGHGLSYTTFELADIRTQKETFASGETIEVSCRVANAGDCDGAEVVQVYVGKPDSAVKRPRKELKGFKKVEVEQGAEITVVISIEVNDLAYYDESRSDWNLERGEYILYVGSASDLISEQLTITVE